MDKKEKYYKFIVDRMVKNTSIDYGYAYTPYGTITHVEFFTEPTDIRDYENTQFLLRKHLADVYGVSAEELYIIWDIYRDRMSTRINGGKENFF